MSIGFSRTSLYFPEIEIPEAWAKHSLLYADELASICPDTLDHVLEGRVAPHMRELLATRFYRTIHPSTALMAGGDGIFDEFAIALLSPKIREQLQQEKELTTTRCVPVHHMKMEPTLRDLLLESGYARSIREGDEKRNHWLEQIHHHDDWLLVRDDVAGIYMDILAKRVASSDCYDDCGGLIRDTTASTDCLLDRDLAFGVRQHPPTETGYGESPFALCLYSRFPTPDPKTPIQRILEFRTRYDDEIPRLREVMDSFEADLFNADDEKQIRHTISRFANTIDEGLRSLHHGLDQVGVGFTTGVLTTLFSLSSSEVLKTLATTYGLSRVIEQFPIEFQGVALAASGAIGFGVAVATRRNRKRDLLESSPFSYLYRVQRELQ